MIDGEGRLRVLDFGLAKLHDPMELGDDTQAATAAAVTEEGKILGTVAYMSPEQAEGKAVDPRSDVFSLGTILYEMATGERPFSGETSMSTISSILRDEPTAVTEINQRCRGTWAESSAGAWPRILTAATRPRSTFATSSSS